MKKHGKTFLRQKSYLLAAVLMLAAVFGMTGVYVSEQRNEKKQQEQLARQEQEQQEREDQLAAVRKAELERQRQQELAEVDKVLEPKNNDLDTPDVVSDADEQAALPEEAPAEAPPEESVQETNTEPVEKTLSFDAAQDMEWPMEGNVIMNYSMDQTIYFATLDQYKYNPALVIQGEVNDKVLSVADGKISNIETNEVTGCTVTVELGDGYNAVYGQLKEVPLSAGDYVEAGDIIGYINEPTKYYSVEGANLYFQMIKDNVSVNPMEFLQ